MRKQFNKIIDSLGIRKTAYTMNGELGKNFEQLKEYMDDEELTFEDLKRTSQRTDLPIEVLKYIAQYILDKKLLDDLTPNDKIFFKIYYKKTILRSKDYTDFRNRIADPSK